MSQCDKNGPAPRTDAVYAPLRDSDRVNWDIDEFEQHARQLERELADLQDEVAAHLTKGTARSSIAPKTFAVYLVDGKPHRMCDCDTMKGDCPRGNERQLQTTQLSRCLVPVDGVLIVGQS